MSETSAGKPANLRQRLFHLTYRYICRKIPISAPVTRGIKSERALLPKRGDVFSEGHDKSQQLQRLFGRSRIKQSRRSCRAQELPEAVPEEQRGRKGKNVPGQFNRLRGGEATQWRQAYAQPFLARRVMVEYGHRILVVTVGESKTIC
jgi:hypothetical protein